MGTEEQPSKQSEDNNTTTVTQSLHNILNMGYNSLRNDDIDSIYARVQKLQYTLFIINVGMLIIALANFSICIWIRFDLDFWEWIEEIGWYTYWNCTYVVMIAMLFHAANSLLSAFGTWMENRALILTSMVLRVFIWILTVVGAVLICLYGVEESKLLINELNEIFLNLIYKWDSDERARRVMTMIQEYVGCCGAENNRYDYINAHKMVPKSCKHPVTGNSYRYECPQMVAWWLEPWTGTLAGVSLGFCILDILIMVISSKIRRLLSMLK